MTSYLTESVLRLVHAQGTTTDRKNVRQSVDILCACISVCDSAHAHICMGVTGGLWPSFSIGLHFIHFRHCLSLNLELTVFFSGKAGWPVNPSNHPSPHRQTSVLRLINSCTWLSTALNSSPDACTTSTCPVPSSLLCYVPILKSPALT